MTRVYGGSRSRPVSMLYTCIYVCMCSLYHLLAYFVCILLVCHPLGSLEYVNSILCIPCIYMLTTYIILLFSYTYTIQYTLTYSAPIVGMEQVLVLSIMRKALDSRSRGGPLRIKSAFTTTTKG